MCGPLGRREGGRKGWRRCNNDNSTSLNLLHYTIDLGGRERTREEGGEGGGVSRNVKI